MRTGRSAATIAALGVVTALVAGCGSSQGFGGIYDLPLPGGADVGSHPYQVTAQFEDVLDLVPQAAVKVNDVAVGRVQSITLPATGWTANVTMIINGDVHRPANATAYLEQTSLLGEKYIELAPPTGATAEGTLANDATIPLSRTNRNPEVEEVFGALSMLLNGGGIGQLQTIDRTSRRRWMASTSSPPRWPPATSRSATCWTTSRQGWRSSTSSAVSWSPCSTR